MRGAPKSRGRGTIIGVLGLALGAAPVTWTLRRVEPHRRYAAVRHRVNSYRGQVGTAWSVEDRQDLWQNFSWFATKAFLDLALGSPREGRTGR